MTRHWKLVAARDAAYAASTSLAHAHIAVRTAEAKVHAAWASYNRLCAAADVPEATVAVAVTRLRRVSARPVEAQTRRPAAETAGLLVNLYDGGWDAAEAIAARADGAGGVPRADRVDSREWRLNLLPDGSEMWQTVPDPIEF